MTAKEYLRNLYIDHSAGVAMNHPRRIEAGRELFEAYEGELIALKRVVDADVEDAPAVRRLVFAAAQVECVGEGWTARVVA